MGTFSPITEENIQANKLHDEMFEISAETIKQIQEAKTQNRKIIAVGTTTVRTLESNSEKLLNAPKNLVGKTDLFIHKPYNFQIVDILITNFHLPKSSLMCLVDAFLQYKNSKQNLVDLYKIAIQEKYRFYSFGDAMLIL